MVFVDENGMKCEVQYCVVSGDEPDKGLKHYIWTSKDKVNNVLKGLDENYDNILKDGGTVSFTNPDWKISFIKRNGNILSGSLEILIDDENSGIDLFNRLSGD